MNKEKRDAQKKTKSRIPQFKTIEEEAEFWDTHSLADYWDEFKPVKVGVAEKLGHGILIELDGETFRALCSLARKKRESPITLAKGWILERLRVEER